MLILIFLYALSDSEYDVKDTWETILFFLHASGLPILYQIKTTDDGSVAASETRVYPEFLCKSFACALNISSYGHDVVYTIWFFFEKVCLLFTEKLYSMYLNVLL